MKKCKRNTLNLKENKRKKVLNVYYALQPTTTTKNEKEQKFHLNACRLHWGGS